jgi:hypothetical protein
MMITLPNSRGDTPIPLPTKPDGSRFPFALTTPQSRAYADSLTELIDALIPGYSALDDGTANLERLLYAVTTQVTLQARLNTAASADTWRSLPDDQRGVLLSDRTQPPELELWEAPIPLVLVDTFYAPFTTRRRPNGNIVWLRPFDETEFLASLAEASLIGVATATATT